MSGDAEAPSVSLPLPPAATAPRAARRFLVTTLRQWRQPKAVVETASLLVTELTANAVRHGHGLVTVTARRRFNVLRVEVNDSSRTLPRRPNDDPERESGRGLWLVEALSSRWGANTCPGDGKDVWFELDTSH